MARPEPAYLGRLALGMARRSLPLLIGVTAGLLVVVSSGVNPRIPILLMLVIPFAAASIARPRVGMLLTIFAICVIDEFPGGIGDSNVGGDEFKRSERTPFYSRSVGLPAIYLTDLLFGGLLILYGLKTILWRESLALRLDKIGVAVGLMAGATLLSIVIPLAGPQPFGPAVLDLGTLGSVQLKDAVVGDVARYVPILHYKLFLMLFVGYFMGLFFFREERDVKAMITVFGAAMCTAIAIATLRLLGDPGMIAQLVPVVFDTSTVAFMAMAVYFSIGVWACGHYGRGRTLMQIVFCALLMLFILTSYRRTMWGAIVVATMLLPFVIPRQALGRLLILFAVGTLLGLIVLGGTPPGQAIAMSILSRLGETNPDNASTLYRFALVVWLVTNAWDLPLFGYGFAPMWNEIVRIRFFTISLENVHSLYLWILLRMGIVGFLMFTVALGLICLRLREVYRMMTDDRYRILVVVVFLSIVMIMFNGIFNPVYANLRHMAPLGFTLALVSRLPYIVRRRETAASEPPAAAPGPLNAPPRPTPEA